MGLAMAVACSLTTPDAVSIWSKTNMGLLDPKAIPEWESTWSH